MLGPVACTCSTLLGPPKCGPFALEDIRRGGGLFAVTLAVRVPRESMSEKASGCAGTPECWGTVEDSSAVRSTLHMI